MPPSYTKMQAQAWLAASEHRPPRSVHARKNSRASHDQGHHTLVYGALAQVCMRPKEIDLQQSLVHEIHNDWHKNKQGACAHSGVRDSAGFTHLTEIHRPRP